MSKKIIFFAAAFLFSAAARADAPKLLRVTPSGKEVSELSQIVLQFDKPMTALGDMERAPEKVPVKITPEAKCSWRWLNTSALACQLAEKDRLVPATRYEVIVEPAFTALDGTLTEKGGTYVIETIRPEIDPKRAYEMPLEMKEPQRPVWRVSFAVPVTVESIEKHLFFKVKNKKTRVTAVRLSQWSAPTYQIEAAEDLGRGVPYEIVYEAGFESDGAGPLKSERKGVLVSAKTLPEFRVEGLECYDKTYKKLTVSPEESVKAPPFCRFGSPVYVILSDRSVSEYQTENGVKRIDSFIRVTPSAAVGDRLEWSDERVRLSGMREGKTYNVTVLPGIADRWGNELASETKLAFKIADRDPNLESPDSAAVLEAGEKTDLTGYAANLEKAEVEYKVFSADGSFEGVYRIPEINPSLRNVQYPFDVGVRKMLKGKSGYLKGEYKTEPALPFKASFGVSVSPWQTVAKFGHFNSLVWIVDMKTGKPVEGVSVRVVRVEGKDAAIPENGETVAKAETKEDGRAVFGGYSSFDGGFEEFGGWSEKTKYFLIAQKGGEMSVMPLTYNFSVWAPSYASGDISTTYNLSPDMHLRAWGVTAQGVYRQGDTVRYKIYVRNENMFSFAPPPEGKYKLTITDPTAKNVLEKDVVLSAFGAADGEFKLPEGAVSGWYEVGLKYNDAEMKPMRFLVSDFTPSPFKVSTELSSDKLTEGETVSADTYATLFSGGAYAGAPVRLTAVLSYAPFEFKNKDFASKRFSFEKNMEMWEMSDETLLNEDGRLDEKGAAKTELKIPSSAKPHGLIRFESSVSDDGGRKTSSSATAEYFNADLFVGVRTTDWTARVGDPVAVEYVVSDRDSKTVANVPVTIEFLLRKNMFVRERTAGNAYVSRYVTENQKVGDCDGVSADKEAVCSFTPSEAGLYTVRAVVKDENGRQHEAQTQFYAAGKGHVLWEADRDNRLDLIPEKESYKAGDTLKLLVKNPMPGATALITAERYGILYSSVEKLDESAPIIEIPVSADFFPGVYVSVSLFSERVEKPSENGADLGKPAEWTGYVKIPVKDDLRRIDVSVKPDKTTYRPRSKAKITLKASLPGGKKEKTEVAVVILDEAVLALLPNGAKAYDPYGGFYTVGSLDVKTYSLISRLIGRRSVEKKGANQGGDGGSDFAVRDLFEYVGYWNPSIVLDENGYGTFEAELPDNLTGWRVLAMAVSETDLMGAGEARFEVNLPLEIRSLLPNQVRTTDSFLPAVSVMNRSKEKRTVKVAFKAEGALKQPVASEKEIVLAPSERGTVFFDGAEAFLPPEKRKGTIRLSFAARSGDDADGMSVDLPVLNLTTMQTAAEYGSSSENASVPLSVSEDVGLFGGSLELSVSPTALGGMEKVIEYMRDYPYSCWEQKISRALSAALYLKLKKSISDKELWADADAFVREVLKDAPAYQAPNGGMAYYQGKNEYVSPYLSAYTGLVFTRLKRAGYEIDPGVWNGLKEYLYAFFRNTPDGVPPQVLRTARLMSMPFLMASDGRLIVSCDFDIMMRDLPMMSVFEKALLLRAASADPAYKKTADEIRGSLLAGVNVTSGTALFQNADETFLSALLASPARNNCAVLSALTANGKPEKDADLAEKLFKGITSLRRKDGTWGNTQADAFCLAATAGYAAAFESEPVSMRVRGKLDDGVLLTANFDAQSNAPSEAKKALGADDAGNRTVSFEKEGTGRYYYKTVLTYPAAKGDAVIAGMEVRRSYEVERDGVFVPVGKDTVLKRGELVRVTLNVSNPAPRTFVVVSDPVPGALEPVNRDLETASKFDADKADDASGTFLSGFYFREMSHSAVNFYAETLEKGEYVMTYAAQVVADGKFNAFPAKVEAMYDPDVFGLGSSLALTVGNVVGETSASEEPVEERRAEDFLPGAIITEEEADPEAETGVLEKLAPKSAISVDPTKVEDIEEAEAAADDDGGVMPEKEDPISFLMRILNKIGLGEE